MFSTPLRTILQNVKRTFTLKNRILEALKLHPMTRSVVAAKLNAHPKAVDGHLSRMSKLDRAEVVKLGRGLYALPGAVYSGPIQTVQAIALFAGINVVPKRSYLAAYSSRIDHKVCLRFMEAWLEQVEQAGLPHGVWSENWMCMNLRWFPTAARWSR
jgi:hypothetical protein